MKKILINMDEDTLILYQSIVDNFTEYYKKIFNVNLENNIIIVNIFNEDNSEVVDFLSKKIALHIMNHVEPYVIKEEAAIACYDLFEDEIEDIITRVNWEMYYKDTKEADKYIEQLTNEIYGLLNELNSFDLYGFINFRFNDRRQKINEYIEFVADQFYEEQNDKDIIDFCKNFLAIQKPKCSQMHIVIHNKTEFEIINENYEKLDIKDLREKIDEECDDTKFILGILMSYVPKKIILHTNNYQSPYLLRLLTKVFGNNIDICIGCNYCKELRIKNDDKNLE